MKINVFVHMINIININIFILLKYIIIIELHNYIKVGEWKNTIEQQKIMLEYP